MSSDDDLPPKERVLKMLCDMPDDAPYGEIWVGLRSLMIIDSITKSRGKERTYTLEEVEARLTQKLAEWHSKSSSPAELSPISRS